MKLLGAAIGSAALSTLPPQWSKPVLASGQLPVHARQSAGGRTLFAGPDDSNANFCFPVTSAVSITLPAADIPLRYSITVSSDVVVTAPAALTGTVVTDAAGNATLDVDVSNTPYDTPIIVTVTWSFDNPADGSGSDSQIFSISSFGC